MASSVETKAKLKTIENRSVKAYRRHLKDASIDYHIVVKRESEQARRSLRDKARMKALKRQDRLRDSYVEDNKRRKSVVSYRSYT